jgi:hypothetical protein
MKPNQVLRVRKKSPSGYAFRLGDNIKVEVTELNAYSDGSSFLNTGQEGAILVVMDDGTYQILQPYHDMGLFYEVLGTADGYSFAPDGE